MFWAPSRELAARRLKEGGHRIYDPREKFALGFFNALLRMASPIMGIRPSAGSLPALSSVRRILALRLDRLGDLVMTLPALAALRKLAVDAEIELAVGSWNKDLAHRLTFVDGVRVVDAPWAAWGQEASWSAAARALQEAGRPDLVIDFQGDIRAILLMAKTGAPLRAGFGDTGGAYLLTHRGPWDESRSWYRQNMDLLEVLFPGEVFPNIIEPLNFLTNTDRERSRELIVESGLGASSRPWIGVHPSSGRAIKQWAVDKFAALCDRLQEATSGTILLTGSASDRGLVEQVASRTRVDALQMVGGAGVRDFAAVVERLDLFITGDTGPMHIAHAVGTPNLAIFGPSDPVRYGPEGPSDKRVVIRQPLYCSPCNMIRKPPRECTQARAPECLDGISVDQVLKSSMILLEKRSNV
jgi:ADP-heptose:LPS heptosyltransferase